MKYYYLHPWNPRFFFPEGFKEYPLFLSLCCPYALPAKVSWWLFRYAAPYRWLFSKTDIENCIPEKEIRAIVGGDALLAFNAGTPGPEQKTTALGWEKGGYFFLKYARTPLAAKNVSNERDALRRVADFDFVPQVLDFVEEPGCVLLRTTVVQGDRVAPVLTDAVLEILLCLAERDSGETGGLKHTFAHGDFCPWNMMNQDGKVWVYDWEMAGIYPLGYDLFTCIFQTAFLLTPAKSVEAVLKENRPLMQRFFGGRGVEDWHPYLEAFARAKVGYIKAQGDPALLDAYSRLLQFSRKPLADSQLPIVGAKGC